MVTTAQFAFFLGYGWTLVLWLASEYMAWCEKCKAAAQQADSKEDLQELYPLLNNGDGANDISLSTAGGETTNRTSRGSPHKTDHQVVLVTSTGLKAPGLEPGSPTLASDAKPRAHHPTLWSDMWNSPLVRCLLLDANALQQERFTLRAMSEFGCLMVWYFLCDRTDVFGGGGKSYSRDLFLFLFAILTCVAVGTSLQTVKQPALLGRQQTEEWKGWMQVLFLLYHYYEAKEAYNAIRIFIAAYVWMTGFGNFIYYYKTQDFSVGRFAQMMWRLNFLVFFVCVVLNNSYMLYYICPMHTIFTVLVYACLGIASHLNRSPAWLAIKMLVCWLAVLVLWHKPVFYAVWSPFTWMVGYLDPRKPDLKDAMHEWYFRSSLDRYVWIYGMLCGWAHPYLQQQLTKIDTLTRSKQVLMRSALLAFCGGVGYVWYQHVYTLDRYSYNKVHPYTSWIPITLWSIVRNLTPTLRLHHLRLYGWLGCITLETYISQFHVWLRTAVADGQPKELMVVVPGYPLLNFAVVTAGYVFVSYRLFDLTNTLKNSAVPHSNNLQLLRNSMLMAAGCAALYGVSHSSLTLLKWAGADEQLHALNAHN